MQPNIAPQVSDPVSRGHMKKATMSLTVAAIALWVPMPAHAQVGRGLEPGSTFEVVTLERVLMERESLGFDPVQESRSWIVVDEVEGAAGRTLTLSFGRSGSGEGLRVTLAPNGTITASEAHFRPLRPLRPSRFPSSYRSVADSVWTTHLRYWAPTGRSVVLPSSRAWDLLPVVPSETLEAGLTWTDTVALNAERDGFRQAWSGVRTSTVLADTTLDGRLYWIVADSMDVRLETSALEYEWGLADFSILERAFSGIQRGRYLLDPVGMMPRSRSDTLRLSGRQVVTLPDGRAFSTGLEWERTRTTTLWASDEAPARRETIRAARRPLFAIEATQPEVSRLRTRVREGNPVLVDSLLTVATSAPDAEVRAEAWDLVKLSLGPCPRRLERDLLLEVGDTTAALVLMQRGYLCRQITRADVEALIPYLEDPGLLHAFGLREQPFFDDLRDRLLGSPPSLLSDTTVWPCRPRACALLADQFERATEPRLRDLGLVAHLALEPRVWADTVLAQSRPYLEPARALVLGVGSRAPIPEPDADWRAWDVWMRRYPADEHPRVSTTHVTAIRMTEVLTGRDIQGEIHAAYATAPNDSAMVVLGKLRLGLGDPIDDLVHAIASGTPRERWLAIGSLERGPARPPLEWAPADPGTTAELMEKALSILVDGTDTWPKLHPDTQGSGLRRLAGPAGRPIFLSRVQLPRQVAERWSDRVQVVDSATYVDRRVEAEEATFINFWSPIIAEGPLVRLRVSYHMRTRLPPRNILIGTWGTFVVFLVRTADGWQMFASTEGIS